MKKLLFIILLILIGWIFVFHARAADIIPPDGIILINNQANPIHSRDVNLIIPASDAMSGVKEMCVSVGTTCTQWVPYTKDTQITLSGGAGTYSICSRVRDYAGNISPQQCVTTYYTGE